MSKWLEIWNPFGEIYAAGMLPSLDGSRCVAIRMMALGHGKHSILCGILFWLMRNGGLWVNNFLLLTTFRVADILSVKRHHLFVWNLHS